LAIASDCEWSVMQMYVRPASRAAIAIVSMSWRPSDAGGVHVHVASQVRERAAAAAACPASAASISPRASRSVGSMHGRPSAA
jgi:hypothetical protein